MRGGLARLAIVAAIGLTGLVGCSILPRLGGVEATDSATSSDTTGSIAAPQTVVAANDARPDAAFNAAFYAPLGVAY